MKEAQRIKGIMLVITSALLWGVSGTVAQFLFQNQGFGPEWLVDIRLISSGIILLMYAYLKDKKEIFKIWNTKHSSLSLLLFSLIGMLGVQYTYFATIKYGNAATATILQYLSPVIITCCLAVSNKKFPDLFEITAVSLAMAGTFFIITKGNIHSIAISKLTLFWGISSAFAAAFYTLQPRKLLTRCSTTTLSGWGMLIGGTAFSFYAKPWHFVGTYSLTTVFAVIFIIIFGTVIAFNCYLDSLKYINATEASVLSSIEPLSAAFLGIVWLHIPFGIYDAIGTLFILSTIVILSYAKK